MKVDNARKLLADANDEEPVVIPKSVLARLKLNDIPEGVSFQIGNMKNHTIYPDWEGRFYRRRSILEAEAEYIQTRKYWYAPIGLEQYMDLVRRAVETRHRLRGDVELTHWDDDGAYIQLLYIIRTNEENPARAFEIALKISGELEQAANRAIDEVGKRIAEVASRLSGWDLIL